MWQYLPFFCLKSSYFAFSLVWPNDASCEEFKGKFFCEIHDKILLFPLAMCCFFKNCLLRDTKTNDHFLFFPYVFSLTIWKRSMFLQTERVNFCNVFHENMMYNSLLRNREASQNSFPLLSFEVFSTSSALRKRKGSILKFCWCFPE